MDAIFGFVTASGLRKGFNLFKGGQPLRHEDSPQKFSVTNLESNFAPPQKLVFHMLFTIF